MAKTVALIQTPGDSEQLYFLGIGALKSYLESKGHQVELLLPQLMLDNFRPSHIERDFQAQFTKLEQFSAVQKKMLSHFLRTLISSIHRLRPQVVGFSILESNVYTSLFLAKELKQVFPKIDFVIGGPETKNLNVDRQQLHFLTSIIQGEAEEIFEEFLSADRDQKQLVKVEGLEFQINHHWQKNPPRATIGDLAKYPLPDLKAIYDHPDFQTKFSNLIVLSFFRGCPFFCSFCSVHDYYKKYRSFPVEVCLDEVEQYSDYNRPIFIADGICNGNPKWLKDFCQGIMQRKLNVKWGGWFRLSRSLANSEVFELLLASGCRHFVFGMESASPKVLDHMNKFSDMRVVYHIFEKMRAFNLQNSGDSISVDLNLIVGYPTETENDFSETLKFLIFNADLISSIASCQRFILPGWQNFKDSLKGHNLQVKDKLNWETSFSTPQIRLERLNRVHNLLDKLNIPISVNTVM